MRPSCVASWWCTRVPGCLCRKAASSMVLQTKDTLGKEGFTGEQCMRCHGTLSTYHPKTVRGSPVYPACKEDPAPKDPGVDCSLRSLLTAKTMCPLLLQGGGITPTDCRGFCLLLRQLSHAENVPQPPSQTHTGTFTKRPLLRFVWFIKSIYLFYFYSTFGQFHGMKLLRIKP